MLHSLGLWVVGATSEVFGECCLPKAAFQYLPDMKFFSWGQVLKYEVTWVRNTVSEHLGSYLVLQSGKAAEEARHSVSSDSGLVFCLFLFFCFFFCFFKMLLTTFNNSS